MGYPEGFSGELIRYNIKNPKGKPPVIRIHFSSYYIAPLAKKPGSWMQACTFQIRTLGSTSWFLWDAALLLFRSHSNQGLGSGRWKISCIFVQKTSALAQFLLNYFYLFTSPLIGKMFCSESGGKSCSYWNKTLSGQWIPEGLGMV